MKKTKKNIIILNILPAIAFIVQLFVNTCLIGTGLYEITHQEITMGSFFITLAVALAYFDIKYIVLSEQASKIAKEIEKRDDFSEIKMSIKTIKPFSKYLFSKENRKQVYIQLLLAVFGLVQIISRSVYRDFGIEFSFCFCLILSVISLMMMNIHILKMKQLNAILEENKKEDKE